MTARRLPWTSLLEALGEARFEEVSGALREAGTDSLSRDAFLLNGAAGKLLRDFVAEDAPASAINAYGALLHMLFLAWSRDWPVATVSREQLRSAITSPGAIQGHAGTPAVCYVQLPERIVWSEVEKGAAHQPLDGAFVLARAELAHVLAVLDFRDGGETFTTMEAEVALPANPPGRRTDGTDAWSSQLPAGQRAGLISVASPAELASLVLLALATAGG